MGDLESGEYLTLHADHNKEQVNLSVVVNSLQEL